MSVGIPLPHLDVEGSSLSGIISVPLWDDLSIRLPPYPINDELRDILENHSVTCKFLDKSRTIIEISEPLLSEYDWFMTHQEDIYEEVVQKIIEYYIQEGFSDLNDALGGMDSEDTSFPFIDTKEKCIAAHLIQLRRVCFILAKDKTAQVQLDFDTYWSEDGLMAIYREGAFYSLDRPTY